MEQKVTDDWSWDEKPVEEPKVETATFELEGRRGTLVYPSMFDYQIVVENILKKNEYSAPSFLPPDSVKCVVDVGAHVGAFSLWSRLLFPNAQIFSFEPCKKQFSFLAQNSRQTGAKVFPFGLSDKTSVAYIHYGELDGADNSIHKSNRTHENGEDILLLSAKDAVKKIGIEEINILKVDTEGSEVPIISSILEARRPWIIYLEYHSEEDRVNLDQMLYKEYTLVASQTTMPHRGMNCYILNKVADQIPDFHKMRITQ